MQLEAEQGKVRNLSSKAEELQKLQVSYQTLEKTLQAREERIKQLSLLEKQLVERDNSLAALNKQRDSAQKEKSDLQQSLKDIEARLAEQKKLNESEKARVTSFEKQLEETRIKADRAEQNLKVTTEKLDQSSEQLAKLGSEKAQLVQSIEKQQSEVNKLQESHASLQKELNSSKEVMLQQEKKLEEVPRLHKGLEEFQKENSELKLEANRASNLEGTLRERDATIVKLKKETESVVERIEAGLAQKDQDIVALEEKLLAKMELEELLAKNELKINELEEQGNRVPALQATVRDRDELIVKLNGESESLHKQLSVEKQKELRHEEQLTVLRKQLAEMAQTEKLAEDLRVQLQKTQSRVVALEPLQQQVTEKDKVVIALREKAVAQDKELKIALEATSKVPELTAALAESRQKLSTNQQLMDDLKSRNAQSDQQFKDLTLRENKVIEERNALKQQLDQAQTSLQQLQELESRNVSLVRRVSEVEQEAKHREKLILESTEVKDKQLKEALEQVSSFTSLASDYRDSQSKLQSATSQLEGIKAELAKKAQLLQQSSESSQQLQQVRNDMQAVQSQLTIAEKKAVDLQQNYQQSQSELAEKSKRLSELTDKVKESDTYLQQMEKLKSTLVAAEQEAALHKESDLELRRLRSEFNSLEKSRDSSVKHAETLEEKIKSEQSALKVLQTDYTKTVGQRDKRISELEARLQKLIAKAEAKPKVAPARASAKTALEKTTAPKIKKGALFAAPKEKDNLKEIHGIGPVMEKTLNKLGVTSFEQIAGFKKADIQRVADAIGNFSDRIERDDWVGGARKCHRAKYGKKAKA